MSEMERIELPPGALGRQVDQAVWESENVRKTRFHGHEVILQAADPDVYGMIRVSVLLDGREQTAFWLAVES
jgi:hypothetical protein